MVQARFISVLMGLSAVCACTVSSEPVTTINPTPTTEPTVSVSGLVTQFDVQTSLRAALQDEAQWSRNFIVSSLAGASDGRLASEQLIGADAAIAAALKPFYADDVNAQLSTALRDHAFGLATILGQATGSPGTSACWQTPSVSCDAKSAWYANADRIAALVAGGTESLNISYTNTRAALHASLDATLAEISASLASGDVGSFTNASIQATAVADAMTKAVAAKGQVMTSETSTGAQQLRTQARPPFEDSVLSMHEAIVSHVSQSSDEAVVVDRLINTSTSIGNLFLPFFGAGRSVQVTTLFHAGVTDAYAYMLATESGDDAGSVTLLTRWYDDTDTLADYLASQNPSWSADALKVKLHANTAQTAAEINARAAQDWQADANAYDAATVNVRSLSDMIADGLAGR